MKISIEDLKNLEKNGMNSEQFEAYVNANKEKQLMGEDAAGNLVPIHIEEDEVAETAKVPMRLRTVDKAYAEILKLDENTEISVHLIRKLALKEHIRSLKSGCKLMVDMISLMDYLGGEPWQNCKMIILD
jgi:hypothetical protein